MITSLFTISKYLINTRLDAALNFNWHTFSLVVKNISFKMQFIPQLELF